MTAALASPGCVFRVLELGLGLLAIVWISRSDWVDRRLTDWIGRFLRRFTDVDVRGTESLVALSGPLQTASSDDFYE